jgi:hypothetical protein
MYSPNQTRFQIKNSNKYNCVSNEIFYRNDTKAEIQKQSEITRESLILDEPKNRVLAKKVNDSLQDVLNFTEPKSNLIIIIFYLKISSLYIQVP